MFYIPLSLKTGRLSPTKTARQPPSAPPPSHQLIVFVCYPHTQTHTGEAGFIRERDGGECVEGRRTVICLCFETLVTIRNWTKKNKKKTIHPTHADDKNALSCPEKVEKRMNFFLISLPSGTRRSWLDLHSRCARWVTGQNSETGWNIEEKLWELHLLSNIKKSMAAKELARMETFFIWTKGRIQPWATQINTRIRNTSLIHMHTEERRSRVEEITNCNVDCEQSVQCVIYRALFRDQTQPSAAVGRAPTWRICPECLYFDGDTLLQVSAENRGCICQPDLIREKQHLAAVVM